MSAETLGRRQLAALWLLPVMLVAPPTNALDEAPAPEFLEFLATWDAEDEDWFDAAMDELADETAPPQMDTGQRPTEAQDDDDER